MSGTDDLFTIVHTPDGQSEEVLRRFVAPLAFELREDPRLDTLFYGCFSVPRCEVRFRVAGPPAWLAALRPRVEERLVRLADEGRILGHELGHYGREVERYGGEAGMRLTERIYHHDSLACLEWVELDDRGELRRSRRELCLSMTEGYLDGLGYKNAERLRFYGFAGRWPAADGDWSDEDLAALDRRYAAVADGLAALTDPGTDADARWGGERSATIAERCLTALNPLLAEAASRHAEGGIRQDLDYLVWSWTHLHANRLGIAALPEAILRQLMLRHHRNRGGGPR